MAVMGYSGAAFALALLYFASGLARGSVVLIGEGVTKSFDDIEASFAPRIRGSGESGILYLAEPLDACTPLTNKVDGSLSLFAFIMRGECKFEDKVRHAQDAGFKAAIVYDDTDNGVLVSMAGNPRGIRIHAVFVSKASGEVLKKYAGRTDVQLWIVPTYENSAWSIMAISFISLLTMSAVLATCFFVRRYHLRRERPRPPHVREFHAMSSQLVKAMPSLIFTAVLEDNCTSSTCTICLEDYTIGEKLRVLPCHHKFHAFCVDSWLTTWRSFCPVCKRDAKTSLETPPASECTPLLSSSVASSSSRTRIPSSRPSSAASSPINIVVQQPSQSPSIRQTHSLSNTPCMSNPRRSFTNSPATSISRSLSNYRNASSRIYHSSHLVSPHSLGFPLSSPNNSRYLPPYIPSSSNASSSHLVGSSNRPSYLQHFSDSGTSLSDLASAHSLPGC